MPSLTYNPVPFTATWDPATTDTYVGTSWQGTFPAPASIIGSGLWRFTIGYLLTFLDVQMTTVNTLLPGRVTSASLALTFACTTIPNTLTDALSISAMGLPFNGHPNPVNADPVLASGSNTPQTWLVDVPNLIGLSTLTLGTTFHAADYAPSAFVFSFDKLGNLNTGTLTVTDFIFTIFYSLALPITSTSLTPPRGSVLGGD